ncbi:hypothetical protein [Saccharothrix carnea]|uniref:hypothetical protein n=1 Tax=Saccharothrix carnea TaxID=1280637 RepID=UPI0011B24F1A|nr:hypothetical protein [Saccharothrix carnea]
MGGLLVAGEYGKAAFDAVGPLLLIGWSEVGPGLLQAISTTTSSSSVVGDGDGQGGPAHEAADDCRGVARFQFTEEIVMQPAGLRAVGWRSPETLLAQARQEDLAHRTARQKPISADALRVRLGIGASQARRLVKIIRSEYEGGRVPPLGNATHNAVAAESFVAA